MFSTMCNPPTEVDTHNRTVGVLDAVGLETSSYGDVVGKLTDGMWGLDPQSEARSLVDYAISQGLVEIREEDEHPGQRRIGLTEAGRAKLAEGPIVPQPDTVGRG